ncbi:unnamed protein product, partial [Polarella glacialis]
AYMRRCIDHMAIDFQRACGSFNGEYISTFATCWCKRDVEKSGLLPFSAVLGLAADLHALGYESWEVDQHEEDQMRK